MTKRVIDSSVVLAVLYNEAGAPALGIEDKLSTVNLAEIVTKLTDSGLSDQALDQIVGRLGVTIVDFDRTLAVAAGRLRRMTRDRGLSLGDRACLALAQSEGLPALTGDRAWAGLDIGVEIELIR